MSLGLWPSKGYGQFLKIIHQIIGQDNVWTNLDQYLVYFVAISSAQYYPCSLCTTSINKQQLVMINDTTLFSCCINDGRLDVAYYEKILASLLLLLLGGFLSNLAAVNWLFWPYPLYSRLITVIMWQQLENSFVFVVTGKVYLSLEETVILLFQYFDYSALKSHWRLALYCQQTIIKCRHFF